MVTERRRSQAGKLFTYNKRFLPTYAEDYCHESPPQPGLHCPVPVSQLYPPRNIPHTLQSFNIWRLPRRRLNPLTGDSFHALAASSKQFLQSCDKPRSTYQEDYTPATSMLAMRNSSSSNTESAEMLTPSGHSLMKHFQPSTTRYGCSKDIVRAARGVIPSVVYTELPATVLYQTRYESEYTNSSEDKLSSCGDKTKSVQFQLPKIKATGLVVKPLS